MDCDDKELADILLSLREKPSMSVGDVLEKRNYEKFAFQGLYEIREASDTVPIYIGMTICAREGVAQRIYDHMNNKDEVRERSWFDPRNLQNLQSAHG